MKRRWLLRLVCTVLALWGVYLLAEILLARSRILEQLLSPSPATSDLYLFLTLAFLCLRLLLYVVLPGWVLARSFLVLTAPANEATP